jgi:hypothetical protein
MDAASNRHAPLLLLVWCIIAGGSIYAALQRHVSPDLLLLVVGAEGREMLLPGSPAYPSTPASGPGSSGAALIHAVPLLPMPQDSTFWLAVVASISLTEAWVKVHPPSLHAGQIVSWPTLHAMSHRAVCVSLQPASPRACSLCPVPPRRLSQFRAPLLDRWRGVDVGRRVFRAQYALEGALAAAAAALLLAKAGGSAVNGSDLVRSLDGRAGLLAAAAAVLLCEVAAVFPALDLRGRRAIAEAAAQAPGLTLQQRAYVAELARGVEGEAKAPPPWLHPLSVSLAFAKAGLLAAFVWQQLLALA